MSNSSPHTDAAASACVHDIVFDEDEEALSWRCEELLPTGPFGSQKEAVAAVKQYSVRQGFAVTIYRSNKNGTKRVFLCCSQGKHYKQSHDRPMALQDRSTKKVGCMYEIAILYDKHAPEKTAWSTLSVNECHNGHIRCIDRAMLSALPAARRATREEEDVDAKVVQMHRDGATPRVSSVHIILLMPLFCLFTAYNFRWKCACTTIVNQLSLKCYCFLILSLGYS